MRRQRITWTALPNGRAGESRLHLSVFAAPRLETDESTRPKLTLFPDFEGWPERVNGMSFIVEVEGGDVLEAERVSPDADPELWAALFPPDTFVRPFAFRDHGDRNIRTIPVRGVLSYLDGLYRRIAERSPEDLPKLVAGPGDDPGATLSDLIDDLGGVHDRLHRWKLQWDRKERYDPDFARSETRALDPDVTSLPGLPNKAAVDFYQAVRFYDRPEMKDAYREKPDASLVPPPPEVPDVDFHQMLAHLGDHPVLLRRLGLVVDLAIPLLPGGDGALRALPAWGEGPSAFGKDFTPWTCYRLTKALFVARALPGSDLADGMVALEDTSDRYADPKTEFDLVQVDPDGAAIKVTGTAASLRETVVRKDGRRLSFDTPDDAGLPALRSSGIAVVRRGRAFRLADFLREARDRDAEADPAKVYLYADHLTRGYRLDVLDETLPAWRSLCRRAGGYRITGPGGDDHVIADVHDEGYVKAASATSADAGDSDLYLHETFVQWDGWSLAAPRPGRTIYPEPSVESGVPKQAEVVDRRPPELATSFKLEAGFAAEPGSLPRLRFGRSYRVRARAVDLAGNSLTPEEAGEAHASESLLYVRYEPVQPPALVPRAVMGEGESIERMVIRSNVDQTAAEYAEDPDVQAALAESDHTYAPENERHVVPPKTSQAMAEALGMLDDSFGAGKDYDLWFGVAAREGATLARDPDGNPLPGSLVVPGAPPPGGLPPGEEAPGAYLVNTEAQFPLAYLPDPFGRGATFRGLPGGEPAETRPFDGAWPGALPFRIRIAERPGAVVAPSCAEAYLNPADPPAWEPEERVLTVFLGKGEVARVRYSCHLDDEDLKRSALWRWISSSPARDALAKAALLGLHWMVTPFRDLVLVHAVQKPLCEPRALLFAQKLSRGDTFAVVRGLGYLSVRSTGQLDIGARWREPVDDLADAAPKEVDGRGHVATLRVDSRLPEPGESPKAWLPLPLPDAETGRPSPEQVRHEFGDTKHRRVLYRLTGTTRFREYFHPALTADSAAITRTGPEVEVDVASSARPEAPRVLYLLPAFSWERERDPEEGAWTRFTSRRRGGGVRVWMERPWYSSGAGELLGVVLSPAPVPGLPEGVRPLISQFGMDPIWDAAVPQGTLRVQDFPEGTPSEGGLALAETEAAQVQVVGFAPEFDPERGLWFADVDLSRKSAPAYFPFVRLALVRYQPDSMDARTKLSRVVQTDFLQLVPPRSLTVTARDEETLDVTLFGPAPDGPIPNRVEVVVEEHTGAVPGELGWTPVAAAEGRPNPTRLAPGLPDPRWIPFDVPADTLVRERVDRLVARWKEVGTSPILRANLPHADVRASVLGNVGRIPVVLLDGYELWSGSVRLPAPRGAGLRVTVTEWEHYAADPDVGKVDRDRQRPAIRGPYLDRVVYAERVEL